MSMSINGAGPVSYAPSPQPQTGSGDTFSQLLNQLASSYGMSPQQLFDLITSAANPSGGGGMSGSPGLPTSGTSGTSGASGASGASGSAGGAGSDELKTVLGQFASNTLNAGNGMMKEAMEKFFQEEEPDEDDPDAEPL
jgi:hypothetical protein